MGGRAANRNSVSLEKNPPTDWEVGEDNKKPKNIRWSAKLGFHAFGGPVVANGLVWVGTNNENPLDPKVKGDFAVLACFRERDGKFLYQYLSPRIFEKVDLDDVGWTADWPHQSLSGSPLIEKDRLFFCTNRGEVVCLDIGDLQKNEGKPRIAWKLDMRKELGVFPTKQMIPGHDSYGSPASYKEFLYVPTGNGIGADHKTIISPEAPSLVCVRKDTGKVVWKDNSPGRNLMFGQYSSPLVIPIDGACQVIMPQGDGWVRSFDAESGKLLWKFDSNRKGAIWKFHFPKKGQETKAYVLATPVFAEGRVFFPTGLFPEAGVDTGRLYCVDPTKRGDISIELEDTSGKVKANPNSGLVWEFAGDPKNDKECMHWSLSSVAVRNGYVVANDRWGLVHCLDAKTGRRHWIHDTKGCIDGSPLIVDDKIYVADEESHVTILELSKSMKVVAKIEMPNTVYTSPVFANGSLYILTDSHLYAIGGK